MSPTRAHSASDTSHVQTIDAPSPAASNEDRPRRAAGVVYRFRNLSLLSKVLSGVVGAALVGAGAYGVTLWTVGLAPGSSGEAQSGAVANLTIVAVASPAATNLLFPGGNGDVVAIITNPNAFPVTVTGLNLPTNTTYATGYTTSALTTT